MTTQELLAALHLLAAFWYVSGLTAVQLPLIRGWGGDDLPTRAASFEEATHYQGVLLVPGAIALGASGLFLWADADYNLLTSGWLVTVEALYILTLLVCLPIAAMALRRARIAALQARRVARSTAEQDASMSDPVPLTFLGLATLLLVPMTLLTLSRPF